LRQNTQFLSSASIVSKKSLDDAVIGQYHNEHETIATNHSRSEQPAEPRPSPPGIGLVNVHTASTALLQFVRQVGVTSVNLLCDFEYALRGQLLDLGVPRTAQTVILVVIMALFVVGAVRLFAGLIRVAVVMVLLLIATQLVMASLHG
jgi:hypothetical protein